MSFTSVSVAGGLWWPQPTYFLDPFFFASGIIACVIQGAVASVPTWFFDPLSSCDRLRGGQLKRVREGDRRQRTSAVYLPPNDEYREGPLPGPCRSNPTCGPTIAMILLSDRRRYLIVVTVRRVGFGCRLGAYKEQSREL